MQVYLHNVREPLIYSTLYSKKYREMLIKSDYKFCARERT